MMSKKRRLAAISEGDPLPLPGLHGRAIPAGRVQVIVDDLIDALVERPMEDVYGDLAAVQGDDTDRAQLAAELAYVRHQAFRELGRRGEIDMKCCLNGVVGIVEAGDTSAYELRQLAQAITDRADQLGQPAGRRKAVRP